MHELACYSDCGSGIVKYFLRNTSIEFYDEYRRGEIEIEKIDEWNRIKRKQFEKRFSVRWFGEARLILSKLIISKKEKLLKLLEKCVYCQVLLGFQ